MFYFYIFLRCISYPWWLAVNTHDLLAENLEFKSQAGHSTAMQIVVRITYEHRRK